MIDWSALSWRGRIILAAVACSSALGCSLLFDFSGYAGDGGADVTAPSDVANDAPLDVVADSGDAGTLGFCASQTSDAALFQCFDFDEPDAAWPGALSSCSGCDASVHEGGFSAPNALVVTMPASPTGALELTEPVPGTYRSLSVSFEFETDSLGGGLLSLYSVGSLEMELSLGPPSALRQFDDVDGGSEYLQSDGSVSVNQATWHRVSIDYDFTTHVVTAALDGTSFITGTFATVPSGSLYLRLGVLYAKPGQSATHFRYDNVVYALYL